MNCAPAEMLKVPDARRKRPADGNREMVKFYHQVISQPGRWVREDARRMIWVTEVISILRKEKVMGAVTLWSKLRFSLTGPFLPLGQFHGLLNSLTLYASEHAVCQAT